jgi:hypothetical protein
MPRLPLIISPLSVRNELAGKGMDEYLTALEDPDGIIEPREYQDNCIADDIQEAQGTIENECEIYLTQRIVQSNPAPPNTVRGTDYDVLETRYPYFAEDWRNGGQVLIVRHRPLQTVHKIALQYGGMSGSAPYNILEVPEQWVTWDGATGCIYVQPLYGAAGGTVAGTLSLALLGQGLNNRHVTPQAVSVKYTAGLLPRNFDVKTMDPYAESPDFEIRDIIQCIRYLAAASMLTTLGMAIGAGGGSISIDGLSESFQANRFAGEIKGYTDAAKQCMERIKARLGSSSPKFAIF